MIEVPATSFFYPARTEAAFDLGGSWYTSLQSVEPAEASVPAFRIGRWEVTNAEFGTFLAATDYWPDDDHNFLRHWGGRSCPHGLEGHPVVWVSLEDARAYADWAGARLPTDLEWQVAGQGSDGRPWPWGWTFESGRCNVYGRGTTPVNSHPWGSSPFGVEDLIGNVWEWVESEGEDGAHRFCHIRGGSYYNPRAHSHWYGPGGPLELHHHRKMLLLSPGFDRSGTVGFRCAS